MISDKIIKKMKKETGYKGCRNCVYQIEALRTCQWAERGGDRQLHFICPRWERRIESMKALSSAQKAGKWINNMNGTFTCDKCGCKHSRSNYCPNCGAYME